MIKVGRHLEGISLNPLEFLLDKYGDIRLFDSIDDAKALLRDAGITEEAIESYFTYIELEDYL